MAPPAQLHADNPGGGSTALRSNQAELLLHQAARQAPRTLVDERYVVQSPIHRGGSDALWSAWDLHQGRLVALKLFHPSSWQGEQQRELLLRQAHLVSQVRHEHVLSVDAAGHCNQTGLIYLSLELCSEFWDGVRHGAQDLLSTRGVDPQEAIRWVVEAARGLQAAHQQGVAHNRLTSTSILIRPLSRRAQVTGFGPVEPVPDAIDVEGPDDNAAREGVRRDLRALGTVLRELLTGADSGAEPLTAARLRRAVQERWPGHLLPAQRRLLTILQRVESSDHTRYESCAAFADDLESYLGQLPLPADPIFHPSRVLLWSQRNRRVLRNALGVALLLLASGTALATLPSLQRKQHDLRQLDLELKSATETPQESHGGE